MRRTGILLTILLMGIFLIGGCGEKKSSAENESVQTIQPKTERQMKHGYDPATNQSLTFGGITVSFPDYWIQYNNDSDNPYYCAETGNRIAELLFTYDKTGMTGSDFTSGISDYISDYLYNRTSDVTDVMMAKATECEGIPAYGIGYQGKIGDKEMIGRCVFVYDPSEENLLVLDLRQTNDTDYIYFDDFNEMVENIVVEGYDGTLEEPETEEEISEATVAVAEETDVREGSDDAEDEETDVSENSLSHKALPYPDESKITNVDDYKSFYRNYKSSYNQNWYRITMPVYGVSGNSIIVHDDLNKILGMISVEFAEPGATSAIRRGDEVTVVAMSDMKILGTLMMYSGYLDGMQKTANSIVDGQVIVIDDYVSFAQKYDSHDIGKIVQITAKVESVGESGFDIEEGFPDDITSGITVTLADGETTKGIKDGDTVTFVGETHSQLWNKLYIDDAHIGAANGDNVVNYTDTEAYAEKNKPKTYTQCTVSQMVSDMKNNPMSAKDRYLDKDLQVTGVITKINSKGKNFYIGVNSSSGTSESVYCSVETEEQRQKLMNLSKGNNVTVRGRCYAAGEWLGYSLELDDIL